MVCSLLLFLSGVLFVGPVTTEKTFGTEMSHAVQGKVVPVAALKQKPTGATGIVFVADDEKVYPVQESDVSRLLFLDRSLQGRPLRLTGRLMKGTLTLIVERVQTVKAGNVFDVDYWCSHCLLSATEPGPCRCCGGDTVLRELAVK